MIHVVINQMPVLKLLVDCRANRGHTATRNGRIAAAMHKRQLKKDVTLTAKVNGSPVVGDAVLVLLVRLGRIDIDAVIKPLQDALQGLLFAKGDDRAIVMSATARQRPGTNMPPIVEAWAYSIDETQSALGRLSSLAYNLKENG